MEHVISFVLGIVGKPRVPLATQTDPRLLRDRRAAIRTVQTRTLNCDCDDCSAGRSFSNFLVDAIVPPAQPNNLATKEGKQLCFRLRPRNMRFTVQPQSSSLRPMQI
jgi:hypothetical protein